MNIFRKWAYRSARITLPDTQLHSAVPVHVTSVARELEFVEGEVVGCCPSTAFHLHGVVSRARAAAQRQEGRHDREWAATTKTGLIAMSVSLCFTLWWWGPIPGFLLAKADRLPGRGRSPQQPFFHPAHPPSALPRFSHPVECHRLTA